MYEGLEDKTVVRTGLEVVDIIDSAESVKVVLADGSIEEGDLVLGVDGVHSRIRSLMWRNANVATPGTITTAEKKSMLHSIRTKHDLQSDHQQRYMRITNYCWDSATQLRR